MEKLLILLSIFFFLNITIIKSAGRYVDAAAVATESKLEKEELHEKLSKESKNTSVIQTLKSLQCLPEVIVKLIMDYSISTYAFAYNLHDRHIARVESLIELNNRQFISGSFDGIKVWHLTPATGSTPGQWSYIGTLKGHTEFVTCLIKLNETCFISGSNDKTIKIWKLVPATDKSTEQWTCIHTLAEHNSWINTLIKLDETHFASGSDTIKIWELVPAIGSEHEKWTCIHTLNENNGGHRLLANCLIKLNNKYFVSNSIDETIKIWRYDSANTIVPVCIQNLTLSEDGYINVLMKLNDTTFVSGSYNGTIKIWQLDPVTERCVCIHTLDERNGGHKKDIESLVKLDDTHFLSNSAEGIKIWQLVPATSSSAEQWVCIHTLSQEKVI